MLGNLIRRHGAGTCVIDEVPLKKARYAFIDTEMTGLDPHNDSIVAIGAVRMADGGISLGDTYYRLVRPESVMKPRSVTIHGITPSELVNEPDMDSLIREFRDYLRGYVVVGHCVGIDLDFINRRLKKAGEDELPGPFVDMYRIYRWLYATSGEFRSRCPSEGANDLYEMAAMFGIPTNGAHNALGDAYITAQLFQRYMRLLVGVGIDNLSRLARVADPVRGEEPFCGSGVFGNF